jgi:hypothetical protein
MQDIATRLRVAALTAALTCTAIPAPVLGQTTTPAAARVSEEEAREIAVEAYVYAYPLVLSELTRRVQVNVEVPTTGQAPMNQFRHAPDFPDATFTNVVRPNADTLYSILWFDVSQGPLAITVPASGGRYYLLPMLDMWSDVFAVPGSRTTGNTAQLFVLAGAGWHGALPPGATLIHSPTAMGWILGRTQTNGIADYPNVHTFQAGLTATPLSQLGTSYTAPKGVVDPHWDMHTPPVAFIEKMSAQDYFGLFAELMKHNPPHANDYPIVHRMARLGIAPGMSFALAMAPAATRQALEAAAAPALAQIKAGFITLGVSQNGWRTNLSTIGTYGTDYRARAVVAYAGLGANPIEDAVYPTAFTDGDGKPFSSDHRYVLHFTREQLPPVRGFWSLTLYDERQLFAANPLNRYAIGDRDPLTFNADGSLDLYIQRDSPGKDKASNWLPAPAQGAFTMNLRLYWPKAAVLDGTWAPVPVQRVK